MKPFEVEYISGGRAWCFCHYHNDTHTPNLCITLNGKYAGRWKCWACGKYGSLDKDQNIVVLNKDKINKCPATDWNKLQRYYNTKLDSYPLVKLAFANQLDINMRTLDYFYIGYSGASITIPMYRRPYYISGIQRQFPDRGKCNIRGSQLGMFMPYWNSYLNEEVIYLCEGFSDTIAVYDLELPSIGIPSCGFFKRYVEEFLYSVFDNEEYRHEYRIVIIPDNNKESLRYSNSLADYLGCDTTLFKFSGAKDVRELIAKKGKECVRKELRGL